MKDCKNFEIAREFLEMYNWPFILNNPRLDRCYCKSCYAAEPQKDTCIAGGNCYVVPRGWTRLGTNIDEDIANELNIWNYWSNSYYGTSVEIAKYIIEHRMFLMPEEQDENEVFINNRKISEDYSFCTTPSIKYASLPQFTTSYKFKSPSDHKKYNITIVLQCKQNPDSFTIQRQSVLASLAKRICPFIPNEKLEWKSKQRSSVIVYGMLFLIEQVKVTFLEIVCRLCRHSNVWSDPKDNQALLVTCSFETCTGKSQLYKGPHCASRNTWIGDIDIDDVLVTCKCLKWLQLIDCPHCRSLNVCKNAFYRTGRNNNVTCAYEDCKKIFQQPLRQRRKSHGN